MVNIGLNNRDLLVVTVGGEGTGKSRSKNRFRDRIIDYWELLKILCQIALTFWFTAITSSYLIEKGTPNFMVTIIVSTGALYMIILASEFMFKKIVKLIQGDQ